MTPAYTAQLGFQLQFTNIETQKIDGFFLQIFEMVLVKF